jgi:hypothetical protein
MLADSEDRWPCAVEHDIRERAVPRLWLTWLGLASALALSCGASPRQTPGPQECSTVIPNCPDGYICTNGYCWLAGANSGEGGSVATSGAASTGGGIATVGSTNSGTGYCTGSPDCDDLPVQAKYCTDRPMCLWSKNAGGSCSYGSSDCTKTATGVESDPSSCTKQLGCRWVAGGSCASGLTLCGAFCVDLSLDVDHCGNCDTVCQPQDHAVPVCQNGACAFLCEGQVNGGGFGDCDGDPSNGCETDLCSSPRCGGCAVPVSSGPCVRGPGGGCQVYQ